MAFSTLVSALNLILPGVELRDIVYEDSNGHIHSGVRLALVQDGWLDKD